MVAKTSSSAVSAFGAAVKAKLANPAISGAPEDQLRGPLETLIRDLNEAAGLVAGELQLVGETSLKHLQVRPDFAVSVNNALVGFIEVKAPGKGFDPRRFPDPHDKAQWDEIQVAAQSPLHRRQWLQPLAKRRARRQRRGVRGRHRNVGSKLRAPDALGALLSDFLN